MTRVVIPAVHQAKANPLDLLAHDGGVTSPIRDATTDIYYHNVIPLVTGDGEFVIVQRPTFAVYNDSTGATNKQGLGCGNWQGSNFWGIKDTFYYNNGVSTLALTTLHNFDSLGAYDTISVAGVEKLAIQFPGDASVDGSLWIQDTTTGVPARVTDADMPGNDGTRLVRGVVGMNGYVYVCNSAGQINNCDLDVPTSWTATNFRTAERNADFGCFLGKHKDHVYYLGSTSVEFFYDAANATGSPLTRRNDIAYNIGCVDPDCVVEVGDNTYFIGMGSDGSPALYVLDQFNLTKVESTRFDSLLRQVGFSTYDGTPLNNSYGIINIQNSGLCYVMTINEGNLSGTYVLHMESGIVSKWYGGGTAANENNYSFADTLPIRGSNLTNIAVDDGDVSDNKVQFENGAMCEITRAGYGDLLDNGIATAPDCFFYTMPTTFNESMDRKKINSIRVQHYPSVNDTLDPATLTIEWYDMRTLLTTGVDGADATMFTQARTVDTSTNNAVIYRCGYTRQRIHKVTLTAGKRQMIKGLEVDFTELRG
jgi:hypothetical protein